MSDMWKSEQRGRSLAIYTILPLLGPVIGAIVGGFVVQSVSWRWIFWGCSAFAACSLSVGFVFLRETFGPVILRRERTAALEDESEPEAENTRDSLILALEELVKVDLPRPFILLSTQPIIQVLALYMAYLYGLNFLTQSTYQTLWQAEYGQTVSIASLNYISVGLGFVLGCEIVAPLNDKVRARFLLWLSSVFTTISLASSRVSSAPLHLARLFPSYSPSLSNLLIRAPHVRPGLRHL